MPSNYQDYVKNAGHMMQVSLLAEEELGAIYLRACLENSLPKYKYPAFYRLFNQIHADSLKAGQINLNPFEGGWQLWHIIRWPSEPAKV